MAIGNVASYGDVPLSSNNKFMNITVKLYVLNKHLSVSIVFGALKKTDHHQMYPDP